MDFMVCNYNKLHHFEVYYVFCHKIVACECILQMLLHCDPIETNPSWEGFLGLLCQGYHINPLPVSLFTLSLFNYTQRCMS